MNMKMVVGTILAAMIGCVIEIAVYLLIDRRRCK